MLLGSAAALAACANTTSKFRTYTGPEVTGVVAYKETRMLHLLHGQRSLASYRFEMGFAPDGPKQQEGDGRTPEGQYFINRRNPNSRYHLSIGISYPNDVDRARARAAGVRPGGDIFIHGTPSNFMGVRDWTVGCIAVTNPEMEEIYSMVRDGTPIWIVANRNSVLQPPSGPAEVIGETREDPDSLASPTAQEILGDTPVAAQTATPGTLPAAVATAAPVAVALVPAVVPATDPATDLGSDITAAAQTVETLPLGSPEGASEVAAVSDIVVQTGATIRPRARPAR